MLVYCEWIGLLFRVLGASIVSIVSPLRRNLLICVLLQEICTSEYVARATPTSSPSCRGPGHTRIWRVLLTGSTSSFCSARSSAFCHFLFTHVVNTLFAASSVSVRTLTAVHYASLTEKSAGLLPLHNRYAFAISSCRRS